MGCVGNRERAISDSNGSFVLETCDPDRPYLWVRAAQHGSMACCPVLQRGGTTRLEIPLRFRGRRLRLTLRADRIVVRGSAGLTVSVPGAGAVTLTGRRLELQRRDDGWSPVGGSARRPRAAPVDHAT